MASRDTLHLVAADHSSAPTGHSSENSDAEATAEDSSVVRTECARHVRRRMSHNSLDDVGPIGFSFDSRTRRPRASHRPGHPRRYPWCVRSARAAADPMSSHAPASSSTGKIVVYEAPDGAVRVDVRLDQETVCLTQQQMAKLFGRDRSVVTRHIRNAFNEGELDPQATSAKFAQVQSEGGRTVSREVAHFNLDVIVSVGLSRQVAAWNPVSPMGHPHPPRPPGPWLHPQPAAPRRTRTQGSPRHPESAGQHVTQLGAGGYHRATSN